jgi:histone H3/H4
MMVAPDNHAVQSFFTAPPGTALVADWVEFLPNPRIDKNMAQESRATGTLPEAHSAALVETQVLNAAMEEFWKKQLEIIKSTFVVHCSSPIYDQCKFAARPDTEYNMDMFRTNLPLARIKKIMKSDDDVRHLMISNEVPALLAKACELFIQDLSTRAWLFTDANHRRTLQVFEKVVLLLGLCFSVSITSEPAHGYCGGGRAKRNV